MKKIFTKQEGLENRGCYTSSKALSLSFMQNDSFTIEELINSEIPLKDKYWFVIKKCNLTVYQKQKIAVDVAELVLPNAATDAAAYAATDANGAAAYAAYAAATANADYNKKLQDYLIGFVNSTEEVEI